jgi:pSer/pThr/pTyr-binding forkhead associated (FHA) protein
VRDLGSRNGTLVNGVRIEGEHVLKSGDKLVVGPLRFEVVVEQGHGMPDSKAAPETKSVQPAQTSGKDWLDNEGDAISRWFDEAEATDRAQRLVDPDTRVLKLDETGRVPVEEASKEKGGGKKGASQKKPPAKLPRKEVDSTKDTRDAAAQMLKKLFNRG